MYKKGSISIFFAITFLTIIVFIMSIYEVTRLQALEMESHYLLMSAGDSVLAAYDSALKNEYGIFARDMSYTDIEYIYKESFVHDIIYDWTVNPNISNGNAITAKHKNGASSDLAYYLSENLRSSEFSASGFSADMISSLRSDTAPTYIKKEIVDFTTINLPATSIRKFFDSLDVAVKLGHTTKFIGRKNNIVKKAGKIEKNFSSLYYYIDGYMVNKGRGKIQLKNYVNRIYANNQINLSMPKQLFPYERIDILTVYDNYKNAFEEAALAAKNLGSIYNEFMPINEEYLRLLEELASIEASMDSIGSEIAYFTKVSDELGETGEISANYSIIIASLEEELAVLAARKASVENEIAAIEDEYYRLKALVEEKMEHLENASIKIAKSIDIVGDLTIDGKILDLDSDAYNYEANEFMEPDISYLNNNKNVFELCEKIGENGSQIGEDISEFLDEEKTKKSDYIYGSYESTKESLEKITKQYGFAIKENYDKKNNLKLISENAKKNYEIINAIKADNDFIYKEIFREIGALYNVENIRKTELDYLNKNVSNSKEVEKIAKKICFNAKSKKDFIEACDTVRKALLGYKNIPNLSYDNALEDNSAILNSYDILKDLYTTCTDLFQSQLVGFDMYELPARLPSYSFAKTEKFDLDEAYLETDIASLDDLAFTDFAGGLSDAGSIKNPASKLLITEYALNMFKGYPDKFIDRESLSGYPVKTHAFDAEVEYIFTGIKNNKLATIAIASKIFAMRIPFNLAFLTINTAKRNEILAFSNMIAGWWSFGAGGLVLSFIVGILWASLESVIDVLVLSHGGKISLIKTDASWHTSLGGISRAGYKDLISVAINKASAISAELLDKLPKAGKVSFKKLCNNFSNEYKEQFQKGIDEVYLRADDAVFRALDNFDILVNDEVNELIKKKENGKILEINSKLGEDEKTILNKAKELIDSADMGNTNYSDFVALKEAVDKKISVQMQVYKEDFKNKHMEKVNERVEQYLEKVDLLVAEMGDDLEESRQQYIKKLESELLKDLEKEFPNINAGEDSDFQLRLDYFDYLRLLSIIEADEDELLARITDMIDLNVTYTKSEIKPVSCDELLFDNMSYRLSFKADFETGFDFIDIGMSPYKISNSEILSYE